jgi:hypothetical protein
MDKPTVEQVAWVFNKICENAGKGTFRYLIYDVMGFESKDYEILYRAGGMSINNAMDIVINEHNIIYRLFWKLFKKIP